MVTSDELKRLEAALASDKELQTAWGRAIERNARSGKARSDGNVVYAAARELGYDVSMAELERPYVESQPVDDTALEAVAGGGQVGADGVDTSTIPRENGAIVSCLYNYLCGTAWKHPSDDHGPPSPAGRTTTAR